MEDHMNDPMTTRWQPALIRTIDIETRLAKLHRPETLAHIHRVAEFARTLASQHGVDPDRAELAALLHEVAAPYSDEQLLAMAEYYEIPVSRTEALVPELLHGKVGAEILRHKWGITDDELLNAVRNHVAGASRMGPTEKVLFLADKLEPDRDKFYGDLDPVRELALTSLDAALAKMSVWQDTELPNPSARETAPLAYDEAAITHLARANF
jgi:predicted HD superfamily hydrolase involved in NAD metabolism